MTHPIDIGICTVTIYHNRAESYVQIGDHSFTDTHFVYDDIEEVVDTVACRYDIPQELIKVINPNLVTP